MNWKRIQKCVAIAEKARKHTARCKACNVIFYYPIPTEQELYSTEARWTAETAAAWYARSAWRNHNKFTRMIRFAADGRDAGRSVRLLGYGCGGGQFALVAK